MYKAKNGFILKDNTTGQGWKVETAQDLKNAILNYPIFQTVHEHALLKAMQRAITVRKEYENITEFAQFLADNYI